MQRVLPFTLALLLVACSDGTDQPTAPDVERPSYAVTRNDQLPFARRVFNSCTGEFIQLAGTVHILRSATADAAGGFHVRSHINLKVSGVGETTGAKYEAVQVNNFTFNAQPPFPVTRTFRINVRIIGQGQTGDIMESILLHFTVNANGEVTAEIRDVEFSCS